MVFTDRHRSRWSRSRSIANVGESRFMQRRTHRPPCSAVFEQQPAAGAQRCGRSAGDGADRVEAIASRGQRGRRFETQIALDRGCGSPSAICRSGLAAAIRSKRLAMQRRTNQSPWRNSTLPMRLRQRCRRATSSAASLWRVGGEDGARAGVPSRWRARWRRCRCRRSATRLVHQPECAPARVRPAIRFRARHQRRRRDREFEVQNPREPVRVGHGFARRAAFDQRREPRRFGGRDAVIRHAPAAGARAPQTHARAAVGVGRVDAPAGLRQQARDGVRKPVHPEMVARLGIGLTGHPLNCDSRRLSIIFQQSIFIIDRAGLGWHPFDPHPPTRGFRNVPDQHPGPAVQGQRLQGRQRSSKSPTRTLQSKWSVVIFMPAAFTFTVLTEIGRHEHYAEFRRPAPRSTCHHRHPFSRTGSGTRPRLWWCGKAKFALVGDPTHALSKAFDVY